MRLLCVEIGSPRVGGDLERSLRIAASMLQQGLDLKLVLLDRGLSREVITCDYGIPADRVTWVPCLNHRYNLAWPAWITLWRLLSSVDLVYLSSFLWGCAPWVWLAALLRGTPWVVNPSGTVPYFGRSLLLKRMCHGLFGRRMLSRAAAVIAVTADEARAIASVVPELRRVEVIPNGFVPVSALPPAMTSRSPGAAACVLCLGRLEPVKGVDLLLAALIKGVGQDLSRVRLTVAGDGSQRQALEAMTDQLPASVTVEFLGHVDGAAKAALFIAADWVVIPSRRDAMTLVALEAAAYARPVLITRQCGFPELARCGGAIEVEASCSGISAGIAQMLQRREEWPAMGRTLHAMAARDYSWAVIGARHLRLFESLVKE